jgi:hypothetical protein
LADEDPTSLSDKEAIIGSLGIDTLSPIIVFG